MSKPGLSQRLYRRLIALYPSVFVEEYGPEMQRQFADEYHEHRESGFRGMLRLWLLAGADLVMSLPRQHAVEFIHDMRFAFRSLRKNSGFCLTVALTLAIAIASVSTVFAYVNALLLHPFPYYKDVHRLVTIWNANPQKGIMHERASYPEYRDWMAGTSVFEESACFAETITPLNDYDSDGRQEPEMTFAYGVSPGFFSVLGATVAFGRTFSAEEEKHPGAKVAVIMHSLWARRFHSDPAIIGRRIVLLGASYTIVGVMPRDFRLLNREADVVIPLPDDPINNIRFVRHFAVLGRLKAGVTLDEAQAQMAAAADSAGRAHAESAGWTTRVIPLLTDSIGHVRSFVLVLAGAVLLVLLIAAANCMNLILARVISRSREIAIRFSLGASRSRVVRQLLTESTVLAFLGCAVAIPAIYWMTILTVALIPDRTSFGKFLPPLEGVRMDGAVIGCAVLAALLMGVFLGAVPALYLSRIRLVENLKEGCRGYSDLTTARLRNCVVIAEVTAAFVLLIGAGLLIRSFDNLRNVDPGFRSDHVTTAFVYLPPSRYLKQEQQWDFFGRLLAQVRAAPGVEEAGAVNMLPMLEWPNPTLQFRLENQPEPPRGEGPETMVRVVTPGYFETMRIPLVAGRTFNRHDIRGTPPVVLINRALARRYWGAENPLSLRIRMSFLKEPLEIAGVVGNTSVQDLREESKGILYFCFDQFANAAMTITIRSGRDPADMAAIVRGAVRELDKELPLDRVSTMTATVSESLWLARFLAVLLAGLAGIAVILATVGIYGLVRYWTTRRTHEIGIRMALGVRPGEVLQMVIGHGTRLAVIGVVLGIPAAALMTRGLDAALYGVSATDSKVFALVAALLVGISVVASFFPARRAVRSDPLMALREE